MIKTILLIFIILWMPIAEASDFATRFRGPNGQGVYPVGSPPATWSLDDVSWKVELPGSGHSSPVVWGTTAFVTSTDAENAGYLLAIRLNDGAILWKKEFDISPYHINNDNSYASPTPTVDAERVYALWFSEERTLLTAFTHDGQPAWTREFGGVYSRHGVGTSPIRVDNKVIFSREQESAKDSPLKSTWMAVHAQTGETVWELERDMAKSNSQSTPVLWSQNGQELLLFTSEAHGVTGVEMATGTVVWEFNPFDARTISSPVLAGELLFASCKGKQLALQLNGADSRVLYELDSKHSPYVPTPIVVDGLLYNFTDNGYISCHNANTGEVFWREKPAGKFYGSPILTNGLLYAMDRDGAVVVLKPDSVYNLVAVNPVAEGSHATPVVVDNKLLVRTFSHLLCVE